MTVHVDPADPRRLRVAADGEDVPADRHPVQEVRGPRVAHEQDHRAHRDGAELAEEGHGDLAGPQEPDGVGDPGNGAPPRDEVRDPAQRVERAQGHDEGMGQAQHGQPEAVDQAAEHPDRRADEDRDGPRPARDVGHREEHRREGHDRADGEIDAGGEDDDVEPERQQRVHRDLAQDVGQVLGREEDVRLEQGQDHRHQQHHAEDAVLLEHPQPAPRGLLRRSDGHPLRPPRARAGRHGPASP